MVIVCPHEGQVSEDEDDHSEVLDEFYFRDLLVEHADKPFSLFSQFVKGVLLLPLDMNRLSSSCSRHVVYALFDVGHG